MASSAESIALLRHAGKILESNALLRHAGNRIFFHLSVNDARLTSALTTGHTTLTLASIHPGINKWHQKSQKQE